MSPGSALCLSARELGTAARYYGASCPVLKVDFWRKNKRSLGAYQGSACPLCRTRGRETRPPYRYVIWHPKRSSESCQNFFSDSELFAIEARRKRPTYTGLGYCRFHARGPDGVATCHCWYTRVLDECTAATKTRYTSRFPLDWPANATVSCAAPQNLLKACQS